MILGMQQLGFELVEQAVLRIADNNELWRQLKTCWKRSC